MHSLNDAEYSYRNHKNKIQTCFSISKENPKKQQTYKTKVSATKYQILNSHMAIISIKHLKHMKTKFLLLFAVHMQHNL